MKSLGKYFIAGALLSVIGLVSCSKDDDDPVVDRGEAVKVEAPAGRIVDVQSRWVGTGNCVIEYYDKTNTADMIMNAAATSVQTYTFSVPDFPFKIKNGIRSSEGKINHDDGETSFSIFSGPVPSNIATPEEAVVFSAKILVDSYKNYYQLVYIPNKSVCVGSTDVKSAMGTFTTKETSYLITFLSDSKAEIMVKNAKFAQNMPSVGDMVFSGLDVTYNEDGFVLTSASLIPTIAGVPYPSFAISDLRMEVDLEELGDADFTFKCSAFGQVFTVVADDMYCLPVGQNR